LPGDPPQNSIPCKQQKMYTVNQNTIYCYLRLCATKQIPQMYRKY
jgi:hypothetical protein